MNRSIPALILLIALSGTAHATDGAFEINETCSVQTGCFPGDSAGFPVTVSQPGSYRLTSNLIVPNENTDGIVVQTSDVGIDLNDFAIIRSGCEGATNDCTPASGTGSGIERTSAALRGTSVRNGSITGMGSFGVYLGEQSQVSGVRARWNRLDGINVYAGSTVSDCAAYQNGRYGITIVTGSTVSGSTAYLNNNIGIRATGGSTIHGNTVYRNGDFGIVGGSGSTISGNTVYDNDGVGIAVDGDSTISGNTVRSNAGDGVEAGFYTLVQGNNLSRNEGLGLDLSIAGTTAAYRENLIGGNTGGTVAGGLNLQNNACNGNMTCP